MKNRSRFTAHVFFIITIVLCWTSSGLADTFVVTNTDDSGAGSLRQAMLDAEANGGPDTIVFNIPAGDAGYNPTAGVWTIQPTSALLELSSDGTVIDGTTQADFIGGDPNPQGPEIVVDGSLLGVSNGFRINGLNNELRGLVINTFSSSQIYITGDSNKVFGCFIGPDATGEDRVANDARGVYIVGGAYNMIGGESEADRNVISGNGRVGIEIYTGSENNQIVGNYIGTTSSGTDTLGNMSGVYFTYKECKHNTIGPLNVISGNNQFGIYLSGTDSDSNRIVGNFIGTDRTGSYALANQYEGILIEGGSKNNLIGGENEGEGNLISGNGGRGIEIYDEGTDQNRIIGNWIGTDVSGTTAIKNRWAGVSISDGAKNNVVGPDNVIAFNGEDGIWVSGSGTLGNTITQNSIHSNERLGIKNQDGGNAELSPPVFTDLGSVSGTAPANSTVEIFSGPDDEGKTYEGVVTADGSGNFSWPGTPTGFWVTATATEGNGNTSEFSGAKHLGNFVVTTTEDSGEGSLRWAIEQANTAAGPDTIEFDIPTIDAGFDGTVWRIRPLSSLPSFTDGGTVVDGNSQTVNQGNSNSEGPEVVLDGRESGSYSSGLEINSSDNVITGLVISGFNYQGISIWGSGVRENWIWGNYIGTNASGNDTLGNGTGISISDGAVHNTVGGTGESEGNLISGNHWQGIFISDSDSNVVIGNLVGTDKTGTQNLGNESDGVEVNWMSVGNRIGGSEVGERNILSGNKNSGLQLYGEGVRDNVVQGNFIGTDVSGTLAIGNDRGIDISYKANNNTIGGTSPEESNVISGNDRYGIMIGDVETDSNRILGNYIGTDGSGESALGNEYTGIFIINGAQYNHIGPANVICYNGWYGIEVSGSSTRYNRITQNSISENTYTGIALSGGGNGEFESPVITGTGSVEGTAPANSTVEIFSGPDDEGKTYETTVTADGSGNFSWPGTPTGLYVTATATSDSGNTSEFSEPKLAGGLIVTNTNDDGDGSLRWAIEITNVSLGPDTIEFNIPPVDEGFDGTVWTIAPSSWLPSLTDSGTVIDGFSQSKNQGNTNPDGPEIFLDGREAGTSSVGLYINSSGNVVSGLIISGFDGEGIYITGSGAEDNWIWGNYIGTNPSGSDTLGNNYGIYVAGDSKKNIIGGTDENERNVISGNHLYGIYIRGADSCVVIGNFVGTDKTGTQDLGNESNGIRLSDGAEGNRIGGSSAGERNIISGNNGSGVIMGYEGTRENVVQGNFIGTNAEGTSAMGNNNHGVHIYYRAASNTVGGLAEGEENVISGNGSSGVLIVDTETDSNQVLGNLIGTDVSGGSDLGNGYRGVHIYGGAQRNQIGPANVIRYNQDRGVQVSGSSTRYNRITQNSISDNDYGGITLSDGGNGELARPVITDVGSVEGTAPPNSTVEIFSDPADEGRIYEGFVVADGSGNFNWAGTPEGPYVTATATNDSGNTSEFSEPFRILFEAIVVTNTDDSGEGSLRWAIEEANNTSGQDSIHFNIPTDDSGFDGTVWTISPLSELPDITDDYTIIDGTTQTISQGDSNATGPEIMLDGRQVPGNPIGLDIESAHCVVSGLIVSGFRGYGSGIRMHYTQAHHNSIIGNYIGTNSSGGDTLGNYHGIICAAEAKHNVIGGTAPEQRNVISGNYGTGVWISNYADSNVVIGNLIGTDITGKDKVSNGDTGIIIGYRSQSNRVGGSLPGERNVISGNTYYGINIGGEYTRFNVIQGNYIGTDIDGTEPLGNGMFGIWISGGTTLNTIGGLSEGEGNVISCNGNEGIRIRDAGTDSNRVLGNLIGTDITGEAELGNGRYGIYVYGGAQYNQIGPGNTIQYNQKDGVSIRNDSTWYNTLTENSISENGLRGIELTDGGNGELSAPVITSSDPVIGTAPPNAKIEIFSSPDEEGKTFEDSVFADASGNFTWAGTPVGPYVTATATDELGNTSEFSDSVLVTSVEVVNTVIPERFSLVQNYPNPFNPETTIRFGVKKDCRVILKVYDLLGREVAKIVDKQYQPGVYEITFDATGLSSGLYFYRIQMGDFQAVKKMVVLE